MQSIFTLWPSSSKANTELQIVGTEEIQSKDIKYIEISIYFVFCFRKEKLSFQHSDLVDIHFIFNMASKDGLRKQHCKIAIAWICHPLASQSNKFD